jgi:hypothetical protein
MAYDLDAIKRKLKEFDGRKSDPDEFRPGKAEKNKPLKYRFYILPGLLQGDKAKSGIVQKSMDLFFVSYGQHWVRNQPSACPRIWDGSDCELCDFGLKLLRDKELSDEERTKIRKDWLPSSNYVVNIYFPNTKINPEELRGKVMYYKAPKTLFDIWTACINRDAPDGSETTSVDDEDAGSSFEPYGVFFDENAAWQFELNVELNGKSNGYKSSKFVYGADKKPVPMIRNEDGSPSHKLIAKIMSERIDIWQRLEVPDRAKIKKLSQVLIHGDDEEDAAPIRSSFDEDEEVDNKPSKKSSPRQSIAEEDEEDQKPSKNNKSSKSSSVDEEDDYKPPKKSKPEEAKKKENTPWQGTDDDDEEIRSMMEQLDDND